MMLGPPEPVPAASSGTEMPELFFDDRPVEHLIVGGGLAGGLLALALAHRGRGRGVLLLEGGAVLGGNHTWSFHESDLDREGLDLVSDLVTRRWPRHVVRFPEHQRTMESGYASVTSEQFSRVLTERLSQAGVRVHLGHAVSDIGPSGVTVAPRRSVRGALVVDARGPELALRETAASGFQKFVGLELELTGDGPWAAPVLMDATVAQVDGYRFTYVLPFSPRRVLIEDTVYSENPSIDPAESEAAILDYAALHGAKVGRVARREQGVLPLPTRARSHGSPPDSSTAPLTLGYRGGFFHAVTGYSLPIAVRVALAVAGAATPAEAHAAVADIARALKPQQAFGCLLNRLMFEAMPPARRWTAFDRFYRLPEATIARFYASRTTFWDRARVLVGRPPSGVSWSHLLGGRKVET